MFVVNKDDCKLNDRIKWVEGEILEGFVVFFFLVVIFDKWFYVEMLDLIVVMICN